MHVKPSHLQYVRCAAYLLSDNTAIYKVLLRLNNCRRRAFCLSMLGLRGEPACMPWACTPEQNAHVTRSRHNMHRKQLQILNFAPMHRVTHRFAATLIACWVLSAGSSAVLTLPAVQKRVGRFSAMSTRASAATLEVATKQNVGAATSKSQTHVGLNSGHHMPLMGWGTSQANGDECIRATKDAIEAGYRVSHSPVVGQYKVFVRVQADPCLVALLVADLG